jgi:hypothetical protein
VPGKQLTRTVTSDSTITARMNVCGSRGFNPITNDAASFAELKIKHSRSDWADLRTHCIPVAYKLCLTGIPDSTYKHA